MIKQLTQTKEILESLYRKYNRKEFIPPDPLQFVYHYSKQADMEIAALLSAVLAYGRVQQIEKSLSGLFKQMGNSPYEFVMHFGVKERRKLQNFKHRFTTGEDICGLLASLKKNLTKHGSIEKIFLLGYRKTDQDIIPALSDFCDLLAGTGATKNNGQASRGLMYLLAHPARGSACKRLNLFLRWMVRDDDVDAGLWKSVDKAKLVVPMDVHMGRLCKMLGFYSGKNVSLKTALETTKNMAKINPDDPVKYDFALSRIGILENCTGQLRQYCKDCQLYEFCFEHKG